MKPHTGQSRAPAKKDRAFSGSPERGMVRRKVIAVMPAYNAEATLEKTWKDIPPGTVDEVVVVDDGSLGQNLGECHSGFRAYARHVLETVPYRQNSDDFVFDTEMLVQAVHFGFRIGDVPVPVRYMPEASSINFRRSVIYGLRTLWTLVRFFAHRWCLMRDSLFVIAYPPLQQNSKRPLPGSATSTGRKLWAPGRGRQQPRPE